MMIRNTLLAAAMLSLAGCATADRVQNLEEKIDDLEEKVAKLEATAAAGGGAARAAAQPSGVDQAKEDAAQKMYEEVAAMVKDGKMDAAKARIAEMEKQFSDTRMWRRASKMAQELAVIGNDAPTAIAVEKWYQGEGEVNIASGGPTLVVFWEEWCPHCRREVPNLEATYNKFKGQGLQMVGLTKITRRSTEESVTEFIKEKEVSYPHRQGDR